MKNVFSLLFFLLTTTFLVAQPGWVGNMFPSGTGNSATTGTGYNITIDVWSDGVTPGPGPGAGISCYVHYGEVAFFGDTWFNVMTGNLMTYSTESGNNDVNIFNLDVAPGLYEYTCYCTDAGGTTWNSGGNGGVTFIAPMPVELTQFEARVIQHEVKLNWATASEIDNSHFEIEKSIDSKNWTLMDKVDGNGNTNLISAYSFFDQSPAIGDNYYRLKQVDFDGQFEYSNLVSVNFRKNKDLLQIQPNPVQTYFTISTNSTDDLETNIVLYNGSGQKVIEQTYTLNQPLAIEDLMPGLYFIHLFDEQGVSIEQLRFVKL